MHGNEIDDIYRELNSLGYGGQYHIMPLYSLEGFAAFNSYGYREVSAYRDGTKWVARLDILAGALVTAPHNTASEAIAAAIDIISDYITIGPSEWAEMEYFGEYDFNSANEWTDEGSYDD